MQVRAFYRVLLAIVATGLLVANMAQAQDFAIRTAVAPASIPDARITELTRTPERSDSYLPRCFRTRGLGFLPDIHARHISDAACRCFVTARCRARRLSGSRRAIPIGAGSPRRIAQESF